MKLEATLIKANSESYDLKLEQKELEGSAELLITERGMAQQEKFEC
jgi:hypothetical protein